MVESNDIDFEEFHRKCSLTSRNKFPIIKLADLPLRKVLNFFEMPDLVDFSTCSSKCQRIVKSLVQRSGEYSIHVKENVVYMDFTTDELPKLTWIFVPETKEEKAKQPDGRRTIDGVIVQNTFKKWSNKTFYTITNEPETNLRLITNYLLNLFPGPICAVVISLALITKSFLGWKEIRECKELLIITSGQSKKELDTVIDNFKVSFSLYTKDRYEYVVLSVKTINAAPHVYIRDAGWMSSEDFLNSRCKSLLIAAHYFYETDINLFIKQWINGEREELETLCMWFRGHIGEVREELLIRGISVEEVDLTKRSGFYRMSCFETLIDCRSGIDIRRSDGKLGTLVANDTVVIFVVWHDLFPDCSVGPMHYWRRHQRSQPIYNREVNRVKVFNSEYEADEYAEAILEV